MRPWTATSSAPTFPVILCATRRGCRPLRRSHLVVSPTRGRRKKKGIRCSYGPLGDDNRLLDGDNGPLDDDNGPLTNQEHSVPCSCLSIPFAYQSKIASHAFLVLDKTISSCVPRYTTIQQTTRIYLYAQLPVSCANQGKGAQRTRGRRRWTAVVREQQP